MDVRSTANFSTRPSIDIRPDVVHIYTKVYNVITRRVPIRSRGHAVSVTGEDFDAVLVPPPPPQPGGLDATFSVVSGSQVRDGEFGSLLSAPFFIVDASFPHISIYAPQIHRTITGDTNLSISVYPSLEQRTITGDSEITNIGVE